MNARKSDRDDERHEQRDAARAETEAIDDLFESLREL
jgi:hypothetical protein